ncbi:Uncharacterised protein [Serratia liquefaciens]|nr:Uncharacterised protein [Serratia liquefaciens]CAI2134256.1 Uncharacterised protein [Serratia liquefaciens]CAI2507694.1 Uncharacterised protein [Serratia liquefaciens]
MENCNNNIDFKKSLSWLKIQFKKNSSYLFNCRI